MSTFSRRLIFSLSISSIPEREPLNIHFGFDVNVRESRNEDFFSTTIGKSYISHIERELAQVEDVLYYIDDKYDEDRRRELQLIEATGRNN